MLRRIGTYVMTGMLLAGVSTSQAQQVEVIRYGFLKGETYLKAQPASRQTWLAGAVSMYNYIAAVQGGQQVRGGQALENWIGA